MLHPLTFGRGRPGDAGPARSIPCRCAAGGVVVPGLSRPESRLAMAGARLEVRAEVAEARACERPRRVASCLAMGAFDQLARRFPAFEPTPPVWRMRCRCPLRAGRPGQIAACECRFWWRAGRRGQWYAISKRRAFRALVPELRRALGDFERGTS